MTICMALVGLVRRVLKLFKVKRGQVYFGCIVILPLDAKYSKPLSDLYLELRLVLVSGCFFFISMDSRRFQPCLLWDFGKTIFFPEFESVCADGLSGFWSDLVCFQRTSWILVILPKHLWGAKQRGRPWEGSQQP